MKAVEKFRSVVRAEIGYLEKKSNAQLDDKTANAGDGNFTKYARDLDRTDIFNGPKNGYAWCAVFAIWPFVVAFGEEIARKMLYLPVKSCAAGVDFLAGYFKAAGRFFASDPQPGDLIFFWGSDLRSWQHTGIVDRTENGRVYTVEGNTSGASGAIGNGGGVAEKSYALTYERIAGYGRPDWALAPEEPGEAESAAPKEAGMTRYNTLEEIRKGAGFALEVVKKLVDRGIIVGGGVKDADGYPADMDLSHDMLRMLCMNDRAGAYDRPETGREYSLIEFVEDVRTALGAHVRATAEELLDRTVTVSESVNSTHAVVGPLQRRLAALGYDQVGEVDGMAGPKFTAAVKAFQTDNGCIVDGEITAGQQTWRKLLGME